MKKELDGMPLIYSEDSERGILSCVMIDPDRVIAMCEEAGIGEGSFYHGGHRAIYSAATWLYGNGQKVDPLAIQSKMVEDGTLERSGGYDYMWKVYESSPSSVNAGSYIATVKKYEVRRKMTGALDEVSEGLKSGEEEDAVVAAGRLIETLCEITSSGQKMKSNFEAIRNQTREWQAAMDGTDTGLDFYLPSVARLLGKLRGGNGVYVIAGMPGSGKSTIAQNMASALAVDQNIPVAINEAEMSHEKLIGRMVCEKADVSMFALDNGMDTEKMPFNESRLERVERVLGRFLNPDKTDRAPLYINDSMMNVDEAKMWGRAMVRRYGARLLIFDYLQLYHPPSKLRLSGTEALQYVMEGFCSLTKQTKTPVVVLSQMPKLPDGRYEPQQDDLFGGRIIDAAAEATLFAYKKPIYADRTKKQIVSYQHMIKIAKNRNGGTGVREVQNQLSRQRFAEPESRDLSRGDYA